MIGTLVSAEDVTGIAEDADEATVRRAIKSLLDKGIRRINVSLAGAFPDNAAEERIVEMISADYPDHFLGSIPALAGSEVVLRPDDSTRTIASLVNAYVHPALATTLYRAEEIVRDQHGWRGNVLIGHINGGVARIGKTKAFDTIESGPLFGTHACAAAADGAGDAKVIAVDVGGTTAKASAVEDGRSCLKSSGDLFDIPLPAGHAAAALDRAGRRLRGSRRPPAGCTLGPDSMGAAPGPACYGLGGRNATITDAFVVAGFVSPTALPRRQPGARRRPRPGGAGQARRRATSGRHRAGRPSSRRGGVGRGRPTGPRDGRGGRMGPGRGDRLRLRRQRAAVRHRRRRPAGCPRSARLFRLGSVYSAYGSAISDVVHVYESGVTGTALHPLADRLDRGGPAGPAR